MASRFLAVDAKTPIQPGTTVQTQGKAEVGEAQTAKGCTDSAVDEWFVIGYAVFLAEWGDIYHPFGPIREWAADLRRSIWSTHAPPRPEFSTTPRGPGGASR